MDNLPRFLFYTTGVIVLSAAFTLITSELLIQVNHSTLTAIFLIIGYGLVYMNIVWVSSRRYMRRLRGPSYKPYVIAFFVALPPIIWVNIYDLNLNEFLFPFLLVIIVSCIIGGYIGHQRGLIAQNIFWDNLQKHINESENIPDDLKQSYKNINKN